MMLPDNLWKDYINHTPYNKIRRDKRVISEEDIKAHKHKKKRRKISKESRRKNR